MDRDRSEKSILIRIIRCNFQVVFKLTRMVKKDKVTKFFLTIKKREKRGKNLGKRFI